MPSKNRISYENKMLHYNADLELVDILCTSINLGELKVENESALFSHIDPTKHPVLSKRSVCQENRRMAAYHLRQTVFGSYIKDMYEEFSRFLRNTIAEAVANLKINPDRLVGEHKVNLSAKEILSLRTITAINEKVVDILFQTLEAEQSTIKLIKKTCDKLGLDISDDLINNALPYLELRHKLVHTDGKLDAEFKRKYPHIRCTNRDYVDLRYVMIREARNHVNNLVFAMDDEALTKGFVNPHVS
ncbi:hypothetical protein [Syntrophomonas curvata]